MQGSEGLGWVSRVQHLSPEMLVDVFIAFFEPFDVLKGDVSGRVEKKKKKTCKNAFVFFSLCEDNGTIPTGKLELFCKPHRLMGWMSRALELGQTACFLDTAGRTKTIACVHHILSSAGGRGALLFPTGTMHGALPVTAVAPHFPLLSLTGYFYCSHWTSVPFQ